MNAGQLGGGEIHTSRSLCWFESSGRRKPLKQTAMTITDYLKKNDEQSLLGSLMQYGFTDEQIDEAESNGDIYIINSMVYLSN